MTARGGARVLYHEDWGEGDPVLALHPLALESSAFAGVAQTLAGRGLRTLAVDLPGFGRSPAPGAPLSPAVMAEPVIELARGLERPALLIGMSLGGRVALEAALAAPDQFRGLVLVAPFLPWRRWWIPSSLARWIDPRWGERVPLERAWPLLRWATRSLERIPDLEHDWLARAAVRVVYDSSCPAIRTAFLSAMREMALDPAFGPESVWTRMHRIRLPITFLWAGRDWLIPRSHRRDLDSLLPGADQLEVPCSGHFVSGAHFRCMRHAIALAVDRNLAAPASDRRRRGARALTPCLADAPELDEEIRAKTGEASAAVAGGGA